MSWTRFATRAAALAALLSFPALCWAGGPIGRIGNPGLDDNTHFEADGTMVMTGAATTFEDLRIDGTSFRVGASAISLVNSPAFEGDSAIHYPEYAEGDVAYFGIQMPHAWKSGTDVMPHVHFTPTTSAAGSAEFTLGCYCADIGGVMGAKKTVTMTDTWGANSEWDHKVAWGTTDMSMTGLGLSACCRCSLLRVDLAGSNPAVALLYFDLHYEMDTVGSRRSGTK